MKFEKMREPNPELVRIGYTDTALEVIDHLQQLTEALAAGTIGFEYYTAFSQRELARINWNDRKF